MLIKLKENNHHISWKFIRKIFLVVVIFILAFFGIYKITGNSRGSFTTSSALDKFIMYGGSSIPGLSLYISNGMKRSTYFGEETLNGIYSLIQRFFPSFISGSHFLESFLLTETLESNIYTMIRSLIADYGIFGMLLVEFLIGVFFSFFYLKIMKSSKEGV